MSLIFLLPYVICYAIESIFHTRSLWAVANITAIVMIAQMFIKEPTPEITITDSIRESLRGKLNTSIAVTGLQECTESDLTDIEMTVRSLIKDHLNELPEFSDYNSKRFIGDIHFYSDYHKAQRVWSFFGLKVANIRGFHAKDNFIYWPELTRADVLKTTLHECLHSFEENEALVEYATLYLIYKYENPGYATLKINQYLNQSQNEYSECIYYLEKVL